MQRRIVTVQSPINIALIKYWGKADEVKVLPTTTSLSVTLTDLWTRTTLSPAMQSSFQLNNQPMSEKEMNRVNQVLSYFPKEPFAFESINNFPTAAGLASSASGMAALTVALDTYFQTNLSFDQLVEITRKGSGSAVRSLADGFALWHQQGHVTTMENPFSDWMMLIVLVSSEKKPISSREAMKMTQTTAPSYEKWRQDSQDDLEAMMQAILEKKEAEVGRIMEGNSERLHALMKDSQPSIVYQQPISLMVLDLVRALRSRFPMTFATMDAGPNVKVLVKKAFVDIIKREIEQHLRCPIMISAIGGKTHVL